MTASKILMSAAAAAVLLIAPIAASATPVALGGTGTRGAHEMASGRMHRHHHMMHRSMRMHRAM